MPCKFSKTLSATVLKAMFADVWWSYNDINHHFWWGWGHYESTIQDKNISELCSWATSAPVPNVRSMTPWEAKAQFQDRINFGYDLNFFENGGYWISSRQLKRVMIIDQWTFKIFPTIKNAWFFIPGAQSEVCRNTGTPLAYPDGLNMAPWPKMGTKMSGCCIWLRPRFNPLFCIWLCLFGLSCSPKRPFEMLKRA